MLYHIEEYAKYLVISGFKQISFKNVETFLKKIRKQTQPVEIQFFDADLVATQEHLYFAVLNALQAFKGKTNISKSPAMETMLYASAQRQIQRALDRCGIKPQTKNMAVVIIGENPGQVETQLQGITASICSQIDESILELSNAKLGKIKKAFKITTEELQTVAKGVGKEKAVVDLVIERVALLASQL
ncbi:MAG: KEOPS complex subunit Cgi121 [Candidatus Bathyarchaeota archaeon]|nr:KEOPS complex subunit Cgi121 [Candidatus Bathyarchaeota archaeon]